MNALINFVSFYAGWFACVLGAAQGNLWLGPVVVSGLLLVHLLRVADASREIRLIAMAGLLGWVVDTTLAALGVFSFGAHSILPWICPPWMVALWMAFASTLRGSLAWLGSRYLLSAGLGAVSAPISYVYGARLGAITLGDPTTASIAAIAVAWAVAMPCLLWLASDRGGQPFIARDPDTHAPQPAASAV